MVVRNWGADYLWMLSFTIFIQLVLRLREKDTQWLLLCTGLGIVWEFLQWFGRVNGTADIGDAAAYLLGSISAILLTRIVAKEEEYE